MNKRTKNIILISSAVAIWIIVVLFAAFSKNPTVSHSVQIHEPQMTLMDSAMTIKFPDSTFFLGYKMGMSPAQVKEHSKALMNNGKLKINEGRYCYDYPGQTMNITYQTYLLFDYHKDELYRLSLVFTGKDKYGKKVQDRPTVWGGWFEDEFERFKVILAFKNDFSYKESIKGNIKVSSIRPEDDPLQYTRQCFVFTDLFREQKRSLQLKREAQNSFIEDLTY